MKKKRVEPSPEFGDADHTTSGVVKPSPPCHTPGGLTAYWNNSESPTVTLTVQIEILEVSDAFSIAPFKDPR